MLIWQNHFAAKEREVAALVKAQWTPTGLLMDANGRIAKATSAAGDTAIRTLVDQIRNEDVRQEFVYFANGNRTTESDKIGEKYSRVFARRYQGRSDRRELFSQGKQTLGYFLESDAARFCVNMMDDLREWDTDAHRRRSRVDRVFGRRSTGA